tara:strand:- start:1657 stop:1890 length:234 start_codon:yes stop_codon:yes gene_type:complete
MDILNEYLEEVSPYNGQLIIDDESITANVFDVELDLLKCEFDGDGSIRIKTENLSYIVLDHLILEQLIDLCSESEVL